jgi:hypothetical protein
LTQQRPAVEAVECELVAQSKNRPLSAWITTFGLDNAITTVVHFPGLAVSLASSGKPMTTLSNSPTPSGRNPL